MNAITFNQAKKYLDFGWSLIPVNVSWNEKEKKFEKKPALDSWKEYQTRKPTLEELHSWFDSGKTNGIGLITGEISHVVVIDLDKTDDDKTFHSPIIVRTISGGKHFYYRWTRPIKGTVRVKGDLIDFRADGNFVVLPPSSCDGKEYKWERFAEPMYLNELPKEFEQIIETRWKKVGGGKSKFTPEIIKGVAQGGRNDAAASFIGKLLKNAKPEEFENAWPLIIAWNSQNQPPLEEPELRITFNSICSREQTERAERGKNKKSETILALDVDGVVDVLDDNGKLAYLKEDGEITDEIETSDGIFTLPLKSDLPYLLPDKDKVLSLINDTSDSSDADLYTRLLNYHKEISELPHELFYDLLVWWDFHTYFLDKLHFSPILYLYAVKERGKSRTGKGCLYVARRGVFTETVREPDIIRWGNDHKAAIGFDVKNFPKKIERANCDDLILARFEKGSISSRTLWPERGAFKDTKTFSLFGPTVVMTNRPVDDILESRAISIDMKPTSRRFNNDVLPENALDLKAQLVAFRFRHREIKLAAADKPADGRLGDILNPLYTMVLTFFPEKKENFQKLLQIIINQKREAATDTFEAQLVETVLKAEDKVEEGFLSVETIANLFNEGKNDNFAVRNETIGRMLKGLGFSSRRTTGGKRGIYYDSSLVNNLALQYGLQGVSEAPSLTSLPDQNQQDKDLEEKMAIFTKSEDKL